MKHYITQLRDDANDSTVHPNIEWKDSSYHNDACPSICADLDGNAEWYVQLFAFENIEEANYLLQHTQSYGTHRIAYSAHYRLSLLKRLSPRQNSLSSYCLCDCLNAYS